MVREHFNIFRVPSAVFVDPILNSQFTGLLKDILTDCCSGMKQKVWRPL
jgi:hypothetical protein